MHTKPKVKLQLDKLSTTADRSTNTEFLSVTPICENVWQIFVHADNNNNITNLFERYSGLKRPDAYYVPA